MNFPHFCFVISCVLVISIPVFSTEAAENDHTTEREVVAAINPKCPENQCLNFTLIHVQLRGKQDTLHHFWTMEKVPTLLYARTELDTDVDINWDSICSGNRTNSISFSKRPQYFAAVMISKFIMYNDVNDTAVIPADDRSIHVYPTSEMSWQLKSHNFTSNSSALVTFRLESYQGSQLNSSTNIEVILTAYGSKGRGPQLPHLMYTENSTQLDLIFENVEPVESFPNARLAIELTTIASETKHPFSLNVSKSLDDEYTPGVFKLLELRSHLDQHFLQWRPVCYTSNVRDIGDSTGVSHTSIQDVDVDLLGDNLLLWVSLETNLESLPAQGFNVTFGIESDGFYKNSNYTAWTLVTGHGRPGEDSFSLMVKLVMAVGLGLPFAVLLIGGTAIAFRNYRNGKDDLLLSN